MNSEVIIYSMELRILPFTSFQTLEAGDGGSKGDILCLVVEKEMLGGHYVYNVLVATLFGVLEIRPFLMILSQRLTLLLIWLLSIRSDGRGFYLENLPFSLYSQPVIPLLVSC